MTRKQPDHMEKGHPLPPADAGKRHAEPAPDAELHPEKEDERLNPGQNTEATGGVGAKPGSVP